ncbi:MAG: cation:proton antiporter, partial [Halothiobacillus sp. 14-56-357]
LTTSVLLVIALARSGSTLFYRVDHQEQQVTAQTVSSFAWLAVFTPLILAAAMVIFALPLTGWLQNTSMQIKDTSVYIRQALDPAVSRLHTEEPKQPNPAHVSPHFPSVNQE